MSDRPADQGSTDATAPTEAEAQATTWSGSKRPWSRRATPHTPHDEEATGSAVVGFMSAPVHRYLRIRRSTLLMVMAFVGLGIVLHFNPPNSDTSTSTGTGAVIHTPKGDVFVPNAIPVSTTTTTVPPTTTTSTTSTTTTTSPSGDSTSSTSTTVPTSAPGSSTTGVPTGGGSVGAGPSSTTTSTTSTTAPGNGRGGASSTTTTSSP